MSIEKIKTNVLLIHPDYIRSKVSDSYVVELGNVLNDAGKRWVFPPVIVQPIPADHADRKEGHQYWILDGMHRTLAAMSMDMELIPAEVMSGLTREEGIALQIKTNNSHGLRLSVSAQTNAIKKLAELKMPQTTIAEKTGLHKSSISRILKGTQRPETPGSNSSENGTADKKDKKPVKKFDASAWMKGLNRLLKAWEKNGSKIRKVGFPKECCDAVQQLTDILLVEE